VAAANRLRRAIYLLGGLVSRANTTQPLHRDVLVKVKERAKKRGPACDVWIDDLAATQLLTALVWAEDGSGRDK
jgi:hypothetical protein